MATRQTRRPTKMSASGAGMGVDAFGGPAIDPTENVLALVDAESKYRDELRAADIRYHDSMREAETRRLNDLATQKNGFDVEMARVLRGNVDEVKKDLQIELRSLNQSRWETAGKSTGRNDVWAYIFGAAGFGAALAAIISFFALKVG